MDETASRRVAILAAQMDHEASAGEFFARGPFLMSGVLTLLVAALAWMVWDATIHLGDEVRPATIRISAVFLGHLPTTLQLQYVWRYMSCVARYDILTTPSLCKRSCELGEMGVCIHPLCARCTRRVDVSTEIVSGVIMVVLTRRRIALSCITTTRKATPLPDAGRTLPGSCRSSRSSQSR